MTPMLEKMIRAGCRGHCNYPACLENAACKSHHRKVLAALSVLRDPDEATVEDMQMAFQETNDEPCSEEAVRAAIATLVERLTGET